MTCPAAAAAAVPECLLPTFDNTFYRPWAVSKFTAKQNIRDNIIISLQSFPPLLLPLLLPPMAADGRPQAVLLYARFIYDSV